MAESKSLRIAYGEALAELGAENDKIVVLDADLSNATMTNRFSAVYPDRFFDFGIAEANMACAAAGFAHEGLIPFISTFALFGAGRAYEQIRNSIAYVNANVKFGFSHSGLCVGEDGGSHQSIEDIALMRVMPNMTIFVPCDAVEVRKAVRAAAAIEGPVYIRVARPVCECFTDESTPFVPGKANIMREGGDVAIIAMGLMVAEALKAAAKYRPHLILLDMMMPVMDGAQTCRAIRQDPQLRDTMVVFLSALGEEDQQLTGFGVGADDYLTKPIKMKLLVSRVQAILKRIDAETAPAEPAAAGIAVDRERYTVTRDGNEIALPRKEFALLDLLYSSPGKLFSREEIYTKIWGTEVVVGDRTIDVHIRKLRQKIGDERIVTIKGVGYKFEP